MLSFMFCGIVIVYVCHLMPKVTLLLFFLHAIFLYFVEWLNGLLCSPLHCCLVIFALDTTVNSLLTVALAVPQQLLLKIPIVPNTTANSFVFQINIELFTAFIWYDSKGSLFLLAMFNIFRYSQAFQDPNSKSNQPQSLDLQSPSKLGNWNILSLYSRQLRIMRFENK